MQSLFLCKEVFGRLSDGLEVGEVERDVDGFFPRLLFEIVDDRMGGITVSSCQIDLCVVFEELLHNLYAYPSIPSYIESEHSDEGCHCSTKNIQ